MRFLAIFALALAAPLAAQDAAVSQSKGRLMTLTLGRYECERPAPAAQPGGVPEPQTSFVVTSSSRYVAPGGVKGTYLFTGDTITMTSGPLAGTRLVRIRQSFLRRIESNGLPGEVRCILR